MAIDGHQGGAVEDSVSDRTDKLDLRANGYRCGLETVEVNAGDGARRAVLANALDWLTF